MNATLQDLSDGRTLSIAVHLPDDFLEGYVNEDEIRSRLGWAFSELLGLGAGVTCQIGPNDEEPR